MSEMLERMAKTICLGDELNPLERLQVGDETIFRWETYQPRARAALSALREPSPAMVHARDGAAYTDSQRNGMTLGYWQAMIDAALDEQKEGAVCDDSSRALGG